MTDMNQDKLDRIKNILRRQHYGHDRVSYDQIDWLIQEVEKLRDKLADKQSTLGKLAEMLREREGNMDGLVQKLRRWLYGREVEFSKANKKVEELERANISLQCATFLLRNRK